MKFLGERTLTGKWPTLCVVLKISLVLHRLQGKAIVRMFPFARRLVKALSSQPKGDSRGDRGPQGRISYQNSPPSLNRDAFALVITRTSDG